MSREAQRDRTRATIVTAAIGVFAERGFRAASTREIAAVADVTQGLLTYHFATKDELWKAAADRIFALLRAEVLAVPPADAGGDARARARQAIVRYVQFTARHPELFRFMVDEGNNDDERMRWLVGEHLKPIFDGIRQLASVIPPTSADSISVATMEPEHLYYVLAGAGSLIFAIAPQCRALTGVDPTDSSVIDRHAALVANLIVP